MTATPRMSAEAYVTTPDLSQVTPVFDGMIDSMIGRFDESLSDRERKNRALWIAHQAVWCALRHSTGPRSPELRAAASELQRQLRLSIGT